MRTRARWLRLGAAAAGVLTSVSACVVPPPPPPPGPPHPLRISYFGDSVTWSYAMGAMVTDATVAGDILPVPGSTRIGCAVGRYTLHEPSSFDPLGAYKPKCDWSQDVVVDGATTLGYQHQVQQNPTDMALVNFCGWDAIERRIPIGPNEWDPVFRALGDPIYEDFLHDELRLMTDQLLAGGARAVVLLTCGTFWDPTTMLPREFAPLLWEWRDFVRALPTVDPRLHLIELGGWIDQQPDWAFFRPDGQHFGDVGPRAVADGYLDAQLLALADQLW